MGALGARPVLAPPHSCHQRALPAPAEAPGAEAPPGSRGSSPAWRSPGQEPHAASPPSGLLRAGEETAKQSQLGPAHPRSPADIESPVPPHPLPRRGDPLQKLSPSTTPHRKRREPRAVSVSVSVSSPPGTGPAVAPGGSKGAPGTPAGLGLPWGSSSAACPSFCTILPPAASAAARWAGPSRAGSLPFPLRSPFVSAAPGPPPPLPVYGALRLRGEPAPTGPRRSARSRRAPRDRRGGSRSVCLDGRRARDTGSRDRAGGTRTTDWGAGGSSGNEAGGRSARAAQARGGGGRALRVLGGAGSGRGEAAAALGRLRREAARA